MPDTEEAETFFVNLNIPTISNPHKEQFDAPITEKEIRTTILSMKTGTSPEMDGFPVEYYKKYVDILAPFILMVYREAFETGTLLDSFNDALITLIPTRERDTSEPSNFRPVSLLGVDFKI